MEFLYGLAGVMVTGLLVYLVVVLFKPELF